MLTTKKEKQTNKTHQKNQKKPKKTKPEILTILWGKSKD